MSGLGHLFRVGGPTRQRPPFTFAAATRVAFSDTDAQGIVYYGRYSPYFDVARVEYFRHLGLHAHTHDDGVAGEFVMRHFEIDYHAPARFDDLLVVFCRVAKLGNSSMTFEYAVTKEDDEATLLAEATQVMVYVDIDKRAAERVPDVFRTAIGDFEGWNDAVALAAVTCSRAGRRRPAGRRSRRRAARPPSSPRRPGGVSRACQAAGAAAAVRPRAARRARPRGAGRARWWCRRWWGRQAAWGDPPGRFGDGQALSLPASNRGKPQVCAKLPCGGSLR
jgi:acyl-CoA thioester hydrolase